MRHGLITLVTILAMTLLLPGISYGADKADYTWNDKLIRGATNIITSPLEIPHHVYTEGKDKSFTHGLTGGLFKGLTEGITRLGTGLVDIVTFPFNYPDAHNAPLMEPEYFLAGYGYKIF